MNPLINHLNQADQTLHSLAQLIALTEMQWLPAQADDSQTNMAWNPDQQRLEGRPFVHANQTIRLVISIDPFAVAFIDDQNKSLNSFIPHGQTPAAAMTWWTTQLQTWGISDHKPVNYHLDQPPIPVAAVYEKPSALTVWGQWRSVANTTLNELNEYSGRASEVRIWPHHFDTGVYYSLTDAVGHERAAIWAGYAIADRVCNGPYFYLSGYEAGKSIDFSAAPALSAGTWKSGADWQGALLPVSTNPAPTQIAAFFRESYHWLIGLLA